MDQIVNLPKAEDASAIETPLGLDRTGLKKKRRRGWLYGLFALIVVAASFAGYQWYAGSPAKIDYTTVPATIADLTVAVSATGTLQPLTQVDISSELSGVVRSVSVDENQQVKKGDVLAALDTAKLEVQIERAEASAKAAAASVEDATVTLAENEKALVRAAELTRRGMATDQSLEAATATRDHSKAALDSAEADLASATTTMTGMLGAVAGVSLLVGGIGIMNIMLVSVTERTREIGIRLAVGAHEKHILIQFLVEATVLSLLGGIIGILIGLALAGLASLTLAIPFAPSPAVILLAVGFSALIGMVFGFFPAIRGARLDPIDALRHE